MGNKPKKILVIDDDPAILDAVTLILTESGYSVEAMNDPLETNAVIKSSPDLVLLDLWLPHIEGSQICRSLKNSQNTKNIPIIIFSAQNNTEKIARASGAEDFISKPFEVVELLEKVEKYL